MRGMVNAFKELEHEVELCIIGGTTKEMTSPAAAHVPFGLKNILKKVIPHIVWSSLKDLKIIQVDIVAQKRLEELVKSFQPDIIYERGFYLMKSGCIVANKYNIPHVMELNAPFEYEQLKLEGNTLLTRQARKIEREMLIQPELICVVSSALKSYFLDGYPEIESQKIIVTPNAIDAKMLKVALNKLSIKNIDEESMVIGFVGSIFPYHGVQNIVELFPKLKLAHSNIKLLIVGDGETLPLLKKRVVELGMENEIIFTGSVAHEQVLDFINLMNITIMPASNWYGSPVKIFEYGVMKKAIIAPNNSPVKDVMDNNIDGLLVDTNQKPLEQAICKFLEDENLRISCAENFHKKVLAEHTWKATAQKVLDTLEHRIP